MDETGTKTTLNVLSNKGEDAAHSSNKWCGTGRYGTYYKCYGTCGRLLNLGVLQIKTTMAIRSARMAAMRICRTNTSKVEDNTTIIIDGTNDFRYCFWHYSG